MGSLDEKTGFSDLQNVAVNFFKFKLYRVTVPLTVENQQFNLVSKALFKF
jgi:hypothetical protein